MTPEDAYRRLRPLFPAAWRAVHEDEFLTTLADAGGPRASLADVADLVRAALTLRARALRGGELTRPAALVGLAVVASVVAALAARSWVDAGPTEFLVTSAVVAAVPGTGVVYTVSSALGGGWRRGLLATVGCTLGIVPTWRRRCSGSPGSCRPVPSPSRPCVGPAWPTCWSWAWR